MTSEGTVLVMMTKKVASALYIILLCAGTIISLYSPQIEATAQEAIVIPNEAIRLRILANSDSDKDQSIKRLVRDAVNKEITVWVKDLTSREEARKQIRSRLPEIQAIAEQVVASQGSAQFVKTEFNKVQFPTKLYGQFLYPAGQYEAILITLGDGDGANWWCVLYPPLCFLDFSNGEAVSDGFEGKSTIEDNGMKDGKESKVDAEFAESKKSKIEKKSDKKPVYEEGNEEEVEVRFFLVDLWNKLFG